MLGPPHQMISERSVPTITNSSGQTLYTDDRELVYVQMAGKYLRNAQLSGMDLQGIDFRDCNLSEANFEGANLSGCKFDNADLSKANLRNAILNGASLKKSNLEYATLENASMQRVNLEDANLQRAWAPRVDLTGSDLSRADLGAANVSNAIVCDVKFFGTQIGNTNLTGVDFTGNKGLEFTSDTAFRTWWRSEDTHGEMDCWPPREFLTYSNDPIFDSSTKWPRGMRFPRRKLNVKSIATQAFWVWVSVSCPLLVCAVLNVGPTRRLWNQYDTFGGLVALVVAAAAIATIAEVLRIIVTNRLVDTNPEYFFGATLHKCEKKFATHTREKESGEAVVSPIDKLNGTNLVHPSCEEDMYSRGPSLFDRTGSHLDFIRSVLKTQ